MRKVLAFDEVTVPAIAVTSNPIPVSTATTKLGIDVIYTKGAEDGIQITLEWQDEARSTWATVSDFGGATSPGVNAILPFTGIISATGEYLFPIPERLLFQGMYRISLVRNGVVAPDGTVTAYLKTGEY